jgi:hypothetical protein
MALPKVAAPKFECVLPSDDTPIKFRPMLVKEEKILLMAQSSGEQKDIINATIDVVQNCIVTENIDIGNRAMVDLEYLFINIRSKSVGNIVDIKITDPDDGNDYDVKVDIDDLEIIKPEKVPNKIDLGQGLGVILRHPSMKQISNISSKATATDAIFDVIIASIDKIYDEDNVYESSDHSKQELDDFVSSLSSTQFKLIQDFFNNIPKISKKISYTKKDGTVREKTLEGLSDFF